jgi:hypothetical protein
MDPARPKRLRFLLFNTVKKAISHARWTLLRLSAALRHALLVLVRAKIDRLGACRRNVLSPILATFRPI